MIETYNCGHPRTAENSRKSGRGTRCKECDKAYHRQYTSECKCGALISIKNRTGMCSPCFLAAAPKCNCGAPLSRKNDTGICRHCKAADKRKSARCIGCDKRIRPNSCGKCATCISHDPAEQARRQAGLRRRFALDPELKKAAADRLRAVTKTPEHAARSRAHMIANRVWEKAPPVEAGSDRAMRIGQGVSANKLAWCPPHLRNAYREIVRNGYAKAEEAKAMILEQNEVEVQRWRRSQGIVLVGNELPPVESLSSHIGPARRVLERATQVFSVSADDIRSESRHQIYLRPRAAIAHVLNRHGWSTPRIAAFLNRNDHTTALNWLKRAKELLSDQAFDCAVGELEEAWALQLPEAMAA